MIPQYIIMAEQVAFSVITVAICAFYIGKLGQLNELSRRLLLAGFFYAIHELSFFINDQAIFELTKVMFFLTFFYCLIHIIALDEDTKKRLEENAKMNAIAMQRLEKLKARMGD